MSDFYKDELDTKDVVCLALKAEEEEKRNKKIQGECTVYAVQERKKGNTKNCFRF